MNASFSILQKLKNQFFQSVTNKSDFHVAFAPFAFTLSNDDFYFLKNNIQTGAEARKYLKEQSEFAYIANSILTKPNIWTVDGNNLLYDAYKEILDNALTIDPDAFTPAELTKINSAKAVLFTKDDMDSAKYTKYKTYVSKYSDIEKQIIDLNALKNTINQTDTAALAKWNVDFTNLNNKKKELLIEWQVKGSKGEIESAKSTYESIILSKLDFIEKWNDAKNTKLAPPNLLTDEFNNEFLITSCIPNSICDYQSPIWKKIVLSKQEINQLAQTFSTEVPSDVLLEFGNLEPELDSISFEYCLIEIQRPWFDESIINNKLWKYADQTIKVSEGDETMTGAIPAYPVKLILSKNIELTFAANSPVNDEIKNKLKEGNRLFFGSLLLKTIPLNLASENIKTYKVQQLTTNELSVITKIAVQNLPATQINEKSKFRMMELLNRQPQTMLKKNVELKSVKPKLMMAQPVAAVPHETVAAAVSPAASRTMMINRTAAFRTVNVAPNRFVLNSGIVGPLPTVTPAEPHVSSITGKIYDTNNKPVSTAEVQLMNNSNASTQSVLTLEDGTYNMINIENGSYQLKVRKSGYVIQERKIDIVNNTNLDFVLEAEAIPTETFQVMGVICKKLPKLPNPLPDGVYI